MRLIDADAFKRQVAAAAIQNGSSVVAERAKVMIDLINAQPTIPEEGKSVGITYVVDSWCECRMELDDGWQYCPK